MNPGIRETMMADDASPPVSAPSDAVRVAVTVRGVVQGVGFRPFVYNAARQACLAGWVRNDSDAVRMEVQGGVEEIEHFLNVLRYHAPRQARIERIETSVIEPVEASPVVEPFLILASQDQAAPGPTIPAELATCDACLDEILDAGQRRYRYPFTNCTNCGPRWSIIERLPYDRPRTSMRWFEMCEDCRREYENPADRRFHAQPIACPNCGPRLKLLMNDGQVIAGGDEALREALAALQAGRILALKGLGGFQLLVDATRADAVRRLRERKRRPDKPLAVMMADLDQVRRYCLTSVAEADVLASPAAPILLLRRHPQLPGNSGLAAEVAPGNPYLGVMLPYTPLHHLLCRELARPVVCTSGNVSEEPMAISTEQAVGRLGRIADLILTHDRPIVRPVDDSVARVDDEGVQLLRRARGYAPLPIHLPHSLPTILAVGGHLKNAIAVNLGADAILSPYIGDLDNLLSVDVHRQTIADLTGFFDVIPDRIACDLHPDYASTRVAERLAVGWKVPLVRVQHHHAHVAACVAEHGLEGPVLGLAWDGTGYGTDRTVWGGEFLLCDGARCQRVGHLRTFPLPGGDAAAREPRRSALGVLFEVLGPASHRLAERWFSAAELRPLLAALQRGRLFPRTSSLGRLFDAVAALCGLLDRVSFEGQAAMALEFAVDPDVQDVYPLPLGGPSPAVADWEPLICGLMDDRSRGLPVGAIAAKFHNSLAELAVAAARRIGCPQVALTGGCFQNAVLQTRLRQRLLDSGFQVYTHRHVPPGDGGIALGQLLLAGKIQEDS